MASPAYELQSAKRSQFRILHFATCVVVGFIADPSCLSACPFCVAIKPTLAQQIDSADMAFLGDCTAVRPITSVPRCDFHVRQILSGKDRLGEQVSVEVPTMTATVGSMALLLGRANNPPVVPDWQCVPLTELSYAYIARLPSRRATVQERLKYFAGFLESADPLIAEDAFLEFGHAPYDEVMQSGKFLSAKKLRGWITDDKVPAERKGFYGLALGITAQGKEREANLTLLEDLAMRNGGTPGADFRAGFDGVLGGYLVAGGRSALQQIESGILADPKAAEGDLRHAQTALRFYYEFGPQDHRPAVAQAVEKLLAHPGTAAAAITDLGRWREWSPLAEIAALYSQPRFAEPLTQRAVVGYLQACPRPEAATALDKLRHSDPRGVAAAEKTLETLSGGN